MAKREKEIATKVQTQLSLPINYEEDNNQGFDNVDRDSVAIPFLRLLQTNSPECNEDDAAYIQGAKAGVFINSVTKELLGNQVTVIPCYYQRTYIQWAPREKGGGFRGYVAIDNEIATKGKRDESNRIVLSNGEYLSDTRNHYILALNGDEVTPMLLSLSSTGIKHSKQWITMMQMRKMLNPQGFAFVPAMYAYFYLIESATEKNEKGTWKGVRISLKKDAAGQPCTVSDVNLYKTAKEFANQVADNKVKVDQPMSQDEY